MIPCLQKYGAVFLDGVLMVWIAAKIFVCIMVYKLRDIGVIYMYVPLACTISCFNNTEFCEGLFISYPTF